MQFHLQKNQKFSGRADPPWTLENPLSRLQPLEATTSPSHFEQLIRQK